MEKGTLKVHLEVTLWCNGQECSELKLRFLVISDVYKMKINSNRYSVVVQIPWHFLQQSTHCQCVIVPQESVCIEHKRLSLYQKQHSGGSSSQVDLSTDRLIVRKAVLLHNVQCGCDTRIHLTFPLMKLVICQSDVIK